MAHKHVDGTPITDFTGLSVSIAVPVRRETATVERPFMVLNTNAKPCVLATLVRTYIAFGRDMFDLVDMYYVAMELNVVQEDFDTVNVTIGWTGSTGFDEQVERMMLSVVDANDIDKLIELIFTSSEEQKQILTQLEK